MSRKNKYPQREAATPRVEPMTSLELALAKTAKTAALRAVSPVRRAMSHSLSERYLSQELISTLPRNEIGTLAAALAPEAVHDLEELLASPEITNLALGTATGILLGKCGRQTNRIDEEL